MRRLRATLRRAWTRAILVTGSITIVLGLARSAVWMRFAFFSIVAGWAVWFSVVSLRARRMRQPGALSASPMAELPAHTARWLEHERKALPGAAQSSLDSISRCLVTLGSQKAALNGQAESALELRRLLAEELPELVSSYRRLPPSLTQKTEAQSASPERQLVEGLAIIEAQLEHLHARLAEPDIMAFETHLQYLRLKYGEGGELTR